VRTHERRETCVTSRGVRIGTLAGVIAVLAATVLASSSAGTSTSTYVVLYKASSVPADAARSIESAGGTLVYSYDQIGVAIARSNSSSFAATMRANSAVEGASSTTGFATQLPASDAGATAGGPPPGDLPNSTATDNDTLSPLQWDMRQIHTPEAHAITGGSPAVLVGDIDTGIDFTHPDLKPNVDVANSVNCVSGAPVPGLAAQDDNGHGTHTAGTIAAASNGIGIVGVAPNVRIAGIKAGNTDGYFFPEAVICSFIWAGSHGVDVTNNSYFADPWLFNCKNDPEQRAIWKAEQRAIKFAQQNGVTVVSAEGNESEDLSHPTVDKTSPDFPPGTNVTRDVTNACVVIPVEIPGVIGASATGSFLQGTDAGQYPDNLKSFYSSYGISTTDVTAPGGDSRYGTAPFNTGVTGRVLSTWPGALAANCALPGRLVTDPGAPGALWCWQQGTSMASPHAAGVAALIVSRYGKLAGPNDATMQPGAVASILQRTADPQACPETLPPGYSAVVGTQSGTPQTCTGGTGHNSWYGSGQVDALGAVS
jgi:lantibiotic leader peptide-processing serine protease